jgi:hypothetical protein
MSIVCVAAVPLAISAHGSSDSESAAAINTFRSIAKFNEAAGNPPVAVTFDDLDSGTDISGRAMCGVRFTKVNTALMVVRGDETVVADGFANVSNPAEFILKATSGAQLLSPGGGQLAPGPNAAIEDDDIILTFDPPVVCMGFDHISQAADGNSYTHVEVFDPEGALLYSGTVEIGPMWEHKRISSLEPADEEHPGGIITADFWGIVSSQMNFARIRIDERDDDNVNADCNIGVDTLRFAPASCGLAGDVNGDNRVDRADLNLVRNDLGASSVTIDHGNVRWNPADINHDGVVKEDDLTIVLDRMGP